MMRTVQLFVFGNGEPWLDGVENGDHKGHGFSRAIGCSDEDIELFAIRVDSDFESLGLDSGGGCFIVFIEGLD